MDIQSFVGILIDGVPNEQRPYQDERVSYPAFQISIKGPGKIFFLFFLTT